MPGKVPWRDNENHTLRLVGTLAFSDKKHGKLDVALLVFHPFGELCLNLAVSRVWRKEGGEGERGFIFQAAFSGEYKWTYAPASVKPHEDIERVVHLLGAGATVVFVNGLLNFISVFYL
jgi:hypothetical protein